MRGNCTLKAYSQLRGESTICYLASYTPRYSYRSSQLTNVCLRGGKRRYINQLLRRTLGGELTSTSFLKLGIKGNTFKDARYSGVGASSSCQCSSSSPGIPTNAERVCIYSFSGIFANTLGFLGTRAVASFGGRKDSKYCSMLFRVWIFATWLVVRR